MQAEERGAGGVAEDAEGRGSPGDPGSSDGSGGLEDPTRGGSGKAGAVASGEPHVVRELDAPGLVEDAFPGPCRHPGCTASWPGRHELQFSLMVPFPSPMEAEMACKFLVTHAQNHGGAGVKELMVSDNLLNICLTGEDTMAIRNSITSCLDQLSPLVLPPCFFIEPILEKED